MTLHECKIVAEIGASHAGQIERAKILIKLAALAGADYVKLQKRNPIECVPPDLRHNPHPNNLFAYGNTYLEHRINLELSIEQHKELKQFCENIGIGYSSSVWDMTSAKEIVSLNPDFIKIGSPTNGNFDVIKFLLCNYSGQVHISTGMSSSDEISSLLHFIACNCDNLNRIVMYHCTSEYPCPFDRLYLLEVSNLREKAAFTWNRPSDEVCIGFSNHGYGIASDIAAYILGAEWIERHFIDDRTFRHSDAAASLEPDGMRRLCRDIKAVRLALSYKSAITEEEMNQRKKLRIN